MRVIRLVLALLVSSGLLVTVGSAPAVACSCAVSQTREHVDLADEIVAGTLVEMVDPPHLPLISSGDPITYTVAVDAVYRGHVGDQVAFESAMSGASCGLEGMEVGRRYVFFLDVEGNTRTANLCGGTALASDGLEAAVERLTGPPVHPGPASVNELAESAGPLTTRVHGDEPAQSAVPLWTVGAGAVGLALVGGSFWLRRRQV